MSSGQGASPFIISKSVMRHPLRNNASESYFQLEHNNLHLSISKKYAQVRSKFGELNKAKLFECLEAKFVDGHLAKVKDLKKSVENNQIDQEQANQEIPMDNAEAKNKETKAKGENENNEPVSGSVVGREQAKDQRIRGYIQENLNSETIKNLYTKYKGKLMKDEITRFKSGETGTIDKQDILSSVNNPYRPIEDNILSELLQEERIGLSSFKGLQGMSILLA